MVLSRARRFLLLSAVAVVAAGGWLRAADDPAPASPGTSGDARVESITVEASRLPAGPGPEANPAAMPIPESPEPPDLPRAVSAHPSIVLYDQTGNGLEPEIDLRGWSEGTASAVLLDGVRLNEPDDNRFDAETVPLWELESVEVRPGAASTVLGAGAAAGALLLRFRGPETDGGVIRLEGGSWGSWRLAGEGSALFGRGGFRASGSGFETDGFRDNSGGRMRHALARGEGRIGRTRVSGTAIRVSSLLHQPGALKGEEWADEPEQAPWNEEDYSDSRTDLAFLRTETPVGRAGSLSGLVSWRGRDLESLTTGRLGGGFRAESDTGASTLVLEYADARGVRRPLRWRAGIEAGEARVHAAGEFTDEAGDAGVFASRVRTERSTAAAFAGASWEFLPRWAVEGSIRRDQDRLATGGEALDPGNGLVAPIGGERSFGSWSPRIALRWRPSPAQSVGLSFSGAILLPTPTDLYAYPTHGSNPELRETRVREWSVSWAREGAGPPAAPGTSATLWRSDARDEIYFVETAPGSGENVNLAATRREGFEASLAWTLPHPAGGRGLPPVEVALSGALTRATFRTEFRMWDGRPVEPGDRIPLVPEWKGAVSATVPLPRGVSLLGTLRAEGEKVLQNDEPNEEAPLGPWAVLDLGARWTGRRAEAFLVVDNVLDRDYATRGIARVPDETLQPADFYTPAPGRSFRAGFTLRLGSSP